MSSNPTLFPVFLKLADRKVLVVGGGVVAASKVEALVPTGARLFVVAPAVRPEIRASGATIRTRAFRSADLDGVCFVVSAATPAVNRAVSRAAERRGLFVNAVDDPPNATAYLGGVLRRDGVTVAISTNGRAPALAGLMREGIDALIPADLDRWFETADDLKKKWRQNRVPMELRRPELLDALVRLYGGRSAGAETPGPATGTAGAEAPGLRTRPAGSEAPGLRTKATSSRNVGPGLQPRPAAEPRS